MAEPSTLAVVALVWLARHFVLCLGLSLGYAAGIAHWTATELWWWRADVHRGRAQARRERRVARGAYDARQRGEREKP